MQTSFSQKCVAHVLRFSLIPIAPIAKTFDISPFSYDCLLSLQALGRWWRQGVIPLFKVRILDCTHRIHFLRYVAIAL